LRCLAAWLARGSVVGDVIEIDTDAGTKRLELLDVTSPRWTFRAAMGQPEAVTKERISVGAETVDAITLRVGNPQCVVLGDVTERRLHGLAASLAVHPRFPAGTNVELASVEAPDRVRILIWERGVGPTEASGTGACAAAVAAIAYGGASRDVYVDAPGGTQRVEWRDDGLYLTGWAEIIADVRWLGSA
jgi:diaminopimelate epimerase